MKVSGEFSGLLTNLVIVIILMWCYCCRLEKVRSKNPAWSCLRFTRSSHTPIVSRTVKITTIQLLRKTSWETRHLNVGFMTFDEKKLARIIYKPHDVGFRRNVIFEFFITHFSITQSQRVFMIGNITFWLKLNILWEFQPQMYFDATSIFLIDNFNQRFKLNTFGN